MLVPSAGEAIPPGYPAQDYRQLLLAAKRHGVGSIGVRVLAGGTLSGSEARHPLGLPRVTPIGSSPDYATDVNRALRFEPVVAAGHAASLPELAVRYVISNPAVSTAEIGIATLDELQQATAAVEKGPLSKEALAEIKAIQTGFAEETFLRGDRLTGHLVRGRAPLARHLVPRMELPNTRRYTDCEVEDTRCILAVIVAADAVG